VSTPGIVWTAPLVERLKALAAQVDPVLSYSEIARILAVEFDARITKNSCIGRGRRIGIPPRQAMPKAAMGFEVNPTKLRPVPRARPKKRYERLEIFDLKHGDCRWPYGERAPFTYCGRKALNGYSYCEEHHKLACPAVRK
jgi:hypothetical protein